MTEINGFHRDARPVALPDAATPLTASMIVAGAMATGDFQKVHHDAEAAREAGLPGIIVNILTTNGLVQSYVKRWSGPGAIVRRIALRLGSPAVPGDTLVLRGTAAWTSATSATVTVTGSTARGNHVTAEIEVSAP